MAFPARLLSLSILTFVTSALAPSLAQVSEDLPLVEERLTVHATRLPDQEDPVQTVPAHVTVLTREDLERSGARTLQDALALEAGVLVYDQVGNDLEKTLDLRGFANGSGTAVFVDGVRINDPRNNTVALETVPLEAVDRIEITRGSAAGLIGGGSEAGVVHVLTRRGEDPGGSLRAAAGSHGARSASGHLQGAVAGMELFASAEHDGTDGFRRRNGDGDLDRFAARAGLPLPGEHRLDLTALVSRLDAGAPGALTRDEIETDPWQSQFNVLDRNQSRTRQAGLAYRGRAVSHLSLAADVYVRDLDADSLTTGRSASLFGGFLLNTGTRVAGSTLQGTHEGRRSSLTAGAEWSEGRVDARGWVTFPPNFIPADPARPLSDNRSDRRTLAVFLRESITPDPRWTLQAGLRADWDRTAYRDFGDIPAEPGRRTFSQVTGRGGVAWNPTSRIGAWATYAESFLPPTPEELFAFPQFGSNSALEPERSRSFEVGWRHRRGDAFELTAAAFRIDTRDEIVFDPDVLTGGVFGTNVNAGKTRRDGLEASVRGHASARVAWFARATVLDATFRSGEASGSTLPLVPRRRASAGAEFDLTQAVRVHGEALHVGAQVLDNDDTNEQPKLPAYTVVNASAVWQAHPRVSLFVEGRNLFDERYATRGIFASSDVFWTPAPGRRWVGGATWTF